METESSHGKTVVSTKEGGLKVNKMASVGTLQIHKIHKKRRGNGSTEKDLSGLNDYMLYQFE